MYALRLTTSRQKRKFCDAIPREEERTKNNNNNNGNDNDNDNSREDELKYDNSAAYTTIDSETMSRHKLEYLSLYFKCRCDDEKSFQKLKTKSETDIIAKAYLCDVLIHNESYCVKKDIPGAQVLALEIHNWIASSCTENIDPLMSALKAYFAAVLLAHGIGIASNQLRASEHLLESTKLGYCLAQYYVGVWYRDGRVITSTKDMEKAVIYFKLAADQGHPIAQNMLGLCFATGNGAMKNTSTAQEYYQLAAQQGLLIARTNLEKLNEK